MIGARAARGCGSHDGDSLSGPIRSPCSEEEPCVAGIRTLREPYAPEVTEADVRAAALQYVRKISGFRTPSARNAAAFAAAVDAVAAATTTLLEQLVVAGGGPAGGAAGGRRPAVQRAGRARRWRRLRPRCGPRAPSPASSASADSATSPGSRVGVGAEPLIGQHLAVVGVGDVEVDRADRPVRSDEQVPSGVEGVVAQQAVHPEAAGQGRDGGVLVDVLRRGVAVDDGREVAGACQTSQRTAPAAVRPAAAPARESTGLPDGLGECGVDLRLERSGVRFFQFHSSVMPPPRRRAGLRVRAFLIRW